MSKTCHILLDRNFMDSLGNIKVNNLSVLETKVDGGKNNKLINKREVKKIDESPKFSDETSESELSQDSNSSDDEGQVRKEIKQKLSKEEPKKLKCLVCDQSFRSHSSYLIHKRSHLPQKFKCSLCNESWKFRSAFISHMKRNHPEIEPFFCEYQSCNKSYKTQKLLESHNKMHFKYMCRFCKKLFARKQNMRKHVLKCH